MGSLVKRGDFICMGAFLLFWDILYMCSKKTEDLKLRTNVQLSTIN
jgi:hypothetical protein